MAGSRSRVWVAAASAIAVCVAGIAAGSAAGGSGALALRQVGSFDGPVHVEDAPGKRNLLFVVEQGGSIEVLRKGKQLAKPFLEISERVKVSYEEGLLSVAFDPNYDRNRRFFVYYVNSDGNIQVDQFKRKRRTAVRARERSRRTVIVIPHPGEENHNGGQLQFGPDGFLYLGTGDGGSGGDPPDNAQNPESLLGKLLRIAPRRKKGYDVPDSNPFVGGAGRDEIYSLGLRNPWRFSFDRANGHLTIGDVGQGAWEEIDHETLESARGANFGWDNLEGTHFYEDPGTEPPNYRPPIHEYTGGSSVIAGFVVRDPSLPALAGRLVYADLSGDEVRSLDPDAADPTATDAGTGLPVDQPASFGEGVGGKIYVTSLGSGGVFRIVQN